jgi:predicted RNase H-like HicB family nuclease
MPRKIRDLIRDLERAGFTDRGGKGNHRNFVHPKVAAVGKSRRRRQEVSGTRGDARNRGISIMKESNRYAKIVEWSDEDGCYVGSAPGLMLGGCHGDNERQVFEELCQIVEETIDLYHQDGRPLPPPTAGRDLANRLQAAVP